MERQLSDSLKTFLPMRPHLGVVGATSAVLPAAIPGFLAAMADCGIRPRNASTNDFRGITISIADDDRDVVGLAYIDATEDAWNEDAFVVDHVRGTVEHLPRGRVGTVLPQYRGTHTRRQAHLLEPDMRLAPNLPGTNSHIRGPD